MVLKKRCYKKDIFRLFNFNYYKIIFILLIKIIIDHIIVSPINNKEICFKKMFLRVFQGNGPSFYYNFNDILTFSFIYTLEKTLATKKTFEAIINIL